MTEPLSRLDAAVLAHRADPTPDTLAELEAAQQSHVDAVHRRQADEFVDRTR